VRTLHLAIAIQLEALEELAIVLVDQEVA